MRRPPQHPQRLHEDAHHQRIDLLVPLIPERLDHLADAGLGHQRRLDAEAQPLQGAVQHPQGGAAQRRVRLAQVAGEAEKADGFGGEEVAQRQVAGRLGTAKQVRQALGAVEAAQAVGQVDPVPRLFDGVVGQAALELAFENAAGVVGAELGQGAHLDDVLHPGAQTGLDGGDLAAFQQIAEAGLGRLHRRLAELAALEQVDVLPADRRQLVAQQLPPSPVADQQKERRRHQHGSSTTRIITACSFVPNAVIRARRAARPFAPSLAAHLPSP